MNSLINQFWVGEPKVDIKPLRQGMGISSTGLENIGNTCYINTTIQCFSAVLALPRISRAFDYMSSCCHDFSS